MHTQHRHQPLTGTAMLQTAYLPPPERVDKLLLFPAAMTCLLIIFDKFLLFPSMSLLKTPPALSAGLLLIAFLLRGLSYYRPTIAAEKWVLAFLFGSACSYAATSERGLLSLSLFGFLDWAQPIVLFIMLSFVAKQSKYNSRTLLAAYSLSALLLFFLSKTYNESLTGGDTRVGYEGINLNRQAYILGSVAILYAWLFLEKPNITGGRRLGVAVLFMLMTAGMLLTGSRTGLVAFAGALVSLIFLSGLHRLNSRVITGAVASVLIATILILNSGSAWSRLSRSLDGDDFGSREKIAVQAWAVSLQSPLVGYGPFASGVLGRELGREIIDAHNAHLQIVLKTGFPVYLIWVGFMISITFLTYRCRQFPEARLAFSALVFSWIFSIGGSLVSSNYYWVTMALIVGGLQPYLRLSRPSSLGNRSLYLSRAIPISSNRRT